MHFPFSTSIHLVMSLTPSSGVCCLKAWELESECRSSDWRLCLVLGLETVVSIWCLVNVAGLGAYTLCLLDIGVFV